MTHDTSINVKTVSHDPSEIVWICWFGAQETFLIVLSLFF